MKLPLGIKIAGIGIIIFAIQVIISNSIFHYFQMASYLIKGLFEGKVYVLGPKSFCELLSRHEVPFCGLVQEPGLATFLPLNSSWPGTAYSLIRVFIAQSFRLVQRKNALMRGAGSQGMTTISFWLANSRHDEWPTPQPEPEIFFGSWTWP